MVVIVVRGMELTVAVIGVRYTGINSGSNYCKKHWH